MSHDFLPEQSRATRVRRNTIRLTLAQGALMASGGVFLTLALIQIVDLSGRQRWAGVALAVYNLSAAFSALLTGRLMDRVGRRPGLVLGYALLGVGGGLAATAVAAGSPWGLLGAAIPFGAGLGIGLLGRVAAADMYSPSQRGRVVGIVIAAGTIGAIAGPPVVAGLQELAESIGADPLVLPWLVVLPLAIAGLVAVLGLRPDPRELAVHDEEEDAGLPTRPRSPRALLQVPPLRAAVVSIGVAQAAMVAVMGVTPVVIDEHGGGNLTVAVIISVHMAGMFALAPAIGALLDRYGRRPGLLAGSVLAACGAGLAAFPDVTPLVGVGLFLVGLGWSASYLGATAAISDLTRAGERGGALGMTDLFTAGASAAGALAGGFLLESGGVGIVAATMAALAVPALLLVLPLREPAPGRWAARGARIADEPT